VLKSVTLISGGLRLNNLRLQPWRYLFEVVVQLQRLGHRVTLISDGQMGITGQIGIREIHLNSTRNPKWKANQTLAKTLNDINTDVALWHLGLTSFVHQNFNSCPGKHALGIFTSPIYFRKDLARLGLFKLISGYPLCMMPVIGSLIPVPLLRRGMEKARLDGLVVQAETTSLILREYQFWTRPIHVIPPGVDEVWLNNQSRTSVEVRRACGFTKQDTVIVYFGPSTQLRGLPTLMKAFALARRYDEKLKLLVLSRKREKALRVNQARAFRLSDHKHISGMYIVDGFLSPAKLASYIAASDIVALPFELVPSDAPLSLLEARASGKPLVTTNVACLPELAGKGAYLVPPNRPKDLANAIRTAIQDTKHQDEGSRHLCKPGSIMSWEQTGAAWSSLIQSL
jgi:glycosyltransferase involved in cell wall biosynthesis